MDPEKLLASRLTNRCITAGTLTYEEAERRRAGWEGCEKLRDAEAGVSHVQVVVCAALSAAELLQSPLLHAVRRMLHQRSHKRLAETGKRNVYLMVPLVLKAQSVEHVLHLSGFVWAEHIKRIPWMIGHRRLNCPGYGSHVELFVQQANNLKENVFKTKAEIADVETLAVPQDCDANKELTAGKAGLRSETAVCVAEDEDGAAVAHLETVSGDVLIDSQFWGIASYLNTAHFDRYQDSLP
ncbi:hypothetical protein EYF80_000910 [Liparis tanakae]|uniref:Uncharacterized protein n=1 Tax=Liparis tanakae TaxID=230148 RepID=A0A4Z2JGD9_9TELE|nr:hypothetical protein EYF80_000910 [Liparis tanakae]